LENPPSLLEEKASTGKQVSSKQETACPDDFSNKTE
jgi:hypothetical protein